MRSRFCIALLAVVLAIMPAGAQSRSPSSPRIDRLKEWMARVAQHQPGQVDGSVTAVRGWTRESLQDIRDDVYALRRLICVRERQLGGRGFCQPPPANTAGRILLQTTVGHRYRTDAREWAGTYTSNHLAALTELVPLVERNINDPAHDPFTYPERDSFVREWYCGTLAFLLRNQGVQVGHVRAGLELFRDDEEVLFLAGSIHEALAAPFYQQGASIRRVGTTAFINSEDAELRQAEQFFRQALKLNPNHVEARLRLGQVLGQQKRRAEALAELRAADTLSSDAFLSYYAALLIAREESALQRVDAARAAYQRAAMLNPGAQSPHIGLSELELRGGDRDAAAQALEAVWALGSGRDAAEDPWSYYAFSAGRNGAARLMALGTKLPSLPVVP